MEIIIEENAEYYAENQDEEMEMTACLFHKTNLLTKTYFALKKYHNLSQLFCIFLKVQLRQAFNIIKWENRVHFLNDAKVHRFNQLRNKVILFKYFNALKNKTSSSTHLQNRYSQFVDRRERQLKDDCFAVLSLNWKKTLAYGKKIEKMRNSKNVGEFFDRLSANLNKKYTSIHIEKQAVALIHKIRKRSGLRRIVDYCLDELEKQKIVIKSQKI